MRINDFLITRPILVKKKSQDIHVLTLKDIPYKFQLSLHLLIINIYNNLFRVFNVYYATRLEFAIYKKDFA